MIMNNINRRQRKYMKKMLQNTQKSHKEFESELNRENFEKQIRVINKPLNKTESEISPNGGKPSFRKPID